jgi:queuosine precursor transporter
MCGIPGPFNLVAFPLVLPSQPLTRLKGMALNHNPPTPAFSTAQMTVTALFVALVLLANMVGGKVFAMGPWAFSSGIVIFPWVFVLTDVAHERWGSAWVKQLSYLTAGIQLLGWLVLQGCMVLPVGPHSPVTQPAFMQVFGASLPVIIGSVVAFVASQWLDVWVFNTLKHRTGARHLWLRATGSTVVSQWLDTTVFVGVAFGGQLPWPVLGQLWLTNYVIKVVLACVTTPLCYAWRGFLPIVRR